MEAQMPEGPQRRVRKQKKMFGYRADPDQAAWIESKVDKRSGIGLTEAMTWAVELARIYEQATKDFERRIKAYAARERLTETEAVQRIIAAGLEQLE